MGGFLFPFFLLLFFFLFFFWPCLLGCEGTLFLDVAFLFLTLIASPLNGGQLHRLVVGERPYFFSLEVAHLSDFNQAIQQHAMLPFSGRVHAFEMDVERRGCGFTDGRPSYSAAGRSQSTARAGVERWRVSGSILCAGGTRIWLLYKGLMGTPGLRTPRCMRAHSL